MTAKKEKYDNLILKFISGDASREETKELVDWLEYDEENKKYFDENLNIWKTTGTSKAKDVSVENAIDFFLKKYENDEIPQIKIKQQKPKIKSLFIKQIAVAASILLLIGITGYLSFKILNLNKVELNSKNEKITSQDLPDGSKISLNFNTSIQYEKDIFKKTRKVYLTGEAYFEIRHLESSSFQVITQTAIIKAIGTSFNVRAYPDEKNIEVYVDSGKVELYPYNNKKIKDDIKNKHEITAGETVIMNKATNSIEKSSGNNNSTAWKTEKLSFYQTKMDEVFKTLEKVYQVEIIIKNTEINNCKLTSDFYHQSIESIMEILESLFQLQITKDKNRFIIQGKGC